MSVGAAGGVGMGGAAMGGGAVGIGAGAPVAASGAAATGMGNGAGQVPGDLSQSTLTPGMQRLVDTLKDFSSAEILIALMLAAAANKDDDDRKSSGAAGALVAGMALSGMLNQGHSLDLNINIQNAAMNGGIGPAGSGGAGLSLNISV